MFGTAASGGSNLIHQPTGTNTQGFLFNNNNSSDDENLDSLTNYQRIDFIFDRPVDFTDFVLADIDTSSSNINNFTDAIAVEGFASNTPGTVGTGIIPNYDIVENELFEKDLDGLKYVSRNTVDNVSSSDLAGQAGISFTQGVESASVYFFNDIRENGGVSTNPSEGHSINISNSVIEIQQVPFEFSSSLGLLLSGASLFGVNYLRRKKVLSQ